MQVQLCALRATHESATCNVHDCAAGPGAHQVREHQGIRSVGSAASARLLTRNATWASSHAQAVGAPFCCVRAQFYSQGNLSDSAHTCTAGRIFISWGFPGVTPSGNASASVAQWSYATHASGASVELYIKVKADAKKMELSLIRWI